jgi:multicomponent Na+:H+ antiporter subunit A
MELLVLMFFGLALAAGLLGRWRRALPWLLAAGPAGCTLWMLMQTRAVGSGAIPAARGSWVPALNLEWAFRLDGLALLMGLLVCGIGFFIILYGAAYFDKDAVARTRFFTLIMMFMGAMFGMVLSDHAMLFFLFWELTSVTSFLLIGFKHKDAGARNAAQQALILTAGGGMALLAALILLANAAGTWFFSEMPAAAEAVKAHPHYPWIIALVALGAATKSAQFPFHFWLPGAMAAPTPVSAYLHSATMVKAGVFLLARLFPVLGGTDLWQKTFGLLGALTMVVSSVLALGQRDLKRLLAYTTVSALGTLVMLLGIGDDLSLQAAMVFLLVHAFYKGALFMVAGTVDHITGTRDINVLRGLRAVMPWTAAGAALAAFSMSGIPPFLGFVAKELLYEARVTAPDIHLPLLLAGVFASMVTVKVAYSVGIAPFKGRVAPEFQDSHDAGRRMRSGFMVLGILSLVAGVAPQVVNELLISPAVRSLDAGAPGLPLKLWHGFNAVLGLSVVTVIAGLLMHWRRHWFQSLAEKGAGLARFGPGAIWQHLWNGLLRFADMVQKGLQTGNLRHYLRMIIAASTALLLFRVLPALPLLRPGSELELRVFETVMVFSMLAAALIAAVTHSRITALLSLSWVGLGITYLFVDFGAPDLALTLILVEALTVVLFAVVIVRLPQIHERDTRRSRVSDGFLACLAGGAAGLVVWKAAHVRLYESISGEFMARSFPEAKGQNVVNVILVDFRAFDTLGELIVLGVAALGVYALVRLEGGSDGSGASPRPPPSGSPLHEPPSPTSPPST